MEWWCEVKGRSGGVGVVLLRATSWRRVKMRHDGGNGKGGTLAWDEGSPAVGDVKGGSGTASRRAASARRKRRRGVAQPHTPRRGGAECWGLAVRVRTAWGAAMSGTASWWRPVVSWPWRVEMRRGRGGAASTAAAGPWLRGGGGVAPPWPPRMPRRGCAALGGFGRESRGSCGGG